MQIYKIYKNKLINKMNNFRIIYVRFKVAKNYKFNNKRKKSKIQKRKINKTKII